MSRRTFFLICAWAVGHSFNLHVGFHRPRWLYVLGITPRGDLPFWTPRTRATDLGQGPNLRRGVRAGSLRATESTAREKTRGWKRKKCRSAKTHLYIVIHTPEYLSQFPCVHLHGGITVVQNTARKKRLIFKSTINRTELETVNLRLRSNYPSRSLGVPRFQPSNNDLIT